MLPSAGNGSTGMQALRLNSSLTIACMVWRLSSSSSDARRSWTALSNPGLVEHLEAFRPGVLDEKRLYLQCCGRHIN